MKELSIKIKISDKEYTLKIDAKDEELLRHAGRIINEKIRQRREKLLTIHKDDLLAMIAFDAMVENLRLKQENSEAASRLTQMNDTLDGLLAEDIQP